MSDLLNEPGTPCRCDGCEALRAGEFDNAGLGQRIVVRPSPVDSERPSGHLARFGEAS